MNKESSIIFVNYLEEFDSHVEYYLFLDFLELHPIVCSTQNQWKIELLQEEIVLKENHLLDKHDRQELLSLSNKNSMYRNKEPRLSLNKNYVFHHESMQDKWTLFNRQKRNQRFDRWITYSVDTYRIECTRFLSFWSIDLLRMVSHFLSLYLSFSFLYLA